MPKRSINLILSEKRKQKKINAVNRMLPVISISLSSVFFFGFLFSLFLVRSQNERVGRLKREASLIEHKVETLKREEGVYTLTGEKLRVLNTLLRVNKNYIPVLDEIEKLTDAGAVIDGASVDYTGNVSFSVAIASVDMLRQFIENIEKKENFKNVWAQGIQRDQKGKYAFTVSLKVDPMILQSL